MRLKIGWVTIREKSLMDSLGCQAGVMVNNNASSLHVGRVSVHGHPTSRIFSGFSSFLAHQNVFMLAVPQDTLLLLIAVCRTEVVILWDDYWSSRKRNTQFELMAFASASVCVYLLCVIIRCVNCLRWVATVTCQASINCKPYKNLTLFQRRWWESSENVLRKGLFIFVVRFRPNSAKLAFHSFTTAKQVLGDI